MLTVNVRKALAEVLGTFVLVFTGFSAVYFGAQGNLLAVAFAFGLALVAAISTFGHISGGHFNPAVSLAMLIDKRLSAKEFVIYVLSQLVGSSLAAVVVFLIAGAPTAAAALPSDAWVVLAYEVVLTFVFVFVILSVSQRASMSKYVGVVIGVTLAGLILAGGNISGAALNPAAALAPSLFVSGAIANYWLYAVGTLLGGGLAALVYKALKAEE